MDRRPPPPPPPADAPTTEDDVLRLVATTRKQNEGKVEGSIVSGDYKTYIELIQKTHKDKGRPIKSMTSPLVIDSIDGVEHQKSKKKFTSVISFSNSVFCLTVLKKGDVTSGSSKNVLTWKQERGIELVFTMKSALNDHMISKHALKEEQ